MNKQDFALSWYAVPTQVDWNNLIASTCQRVLVGYSVAKSQPNVLARLHGLGCRVVIRIEQDNQEPPAWLAQELNTISHILPVDAVIVGVEPDAGCDFHIGSASWCQDAAYHNVQRVSALIQAVQGLGLKAVSPAMSYPPDAISEDGIPLPGRTTFREIVAPTYQKAEGCAVHIYALGWASVVDNLRFKFGLKWAAEAWHKDLWIDEAGVLEASDTDKMQAYVSMADIVMRHPVNPRVHLFSPFCSAGTPSGWDSRYLIKDRLAYELLRRWLQS